MMMFRYLPWCWDIITALVVGVSCTLVLVVLLVVVCQVVLVACWL